MPSPQDPIRVVGARQNNLKDLTLDIPLGELIVVTGVSGSGKSSLAFDTIYAEGQRRYIETFSAYARQFLDRMDKPRVERIEGIPPAIAIDQTNPVRTSRSTVGTMTELSDYLKLLYARAASLFCGGCGRQVTRDSPDSSYDALVRDLDQGTAVLITFAVPVPEIASEQSLLDFLNQQGYTRIHARSGGALEMIQDRLRLAPDSRDRAVEALESAFRMGNGRAAVYPLDSERNPLPPHRYSADLHCPHCDIHYREPLPNLFSFNSPVGACETCRGFGRVMGIDWGLVVPDESLSLRAGAVKPLQSDSYLDVQGDLLRHAVERGVPIDTPWRELSGQDRRWVIQGNGRKGRKQWYGVQKFFDWLEGKSYKMHIRVLLSKYRSYDRCPDCDGARLKDEALNWRLGDKALADAVLQPQQRFRPARSGLDPTAYAELAGLHVHDLVGLPLARCLDFFEALRLPAPLDRATEQLLLEIRGRLHYLNQVGLGYLTLDRQSRTLSGGEVQRINLTTALGTSLVNTLFVLDEPSIGLHPRDIERVIAVLQRLRDAGNSLLVVEHDPALMLAADRILDIGPGPGEAGGRVVSFASPENTLNSEQSLTAQYLRGEKRIDRPAPYPEKAPPQGFLTVSGAAEHNLKGIDLRIPLNRLVCLTGVSGSGKSTLLEDVIYRGICKRLGRAVEAPGRHADIAGHERFADLVLVDQSPIGKTTRSNPASYVGALDPIRKLFAAEPLARERKYTAGTFSFNAGKGRCPECGGTGFEHVEMQFLSDVYLRCPACDGQRYRPDVLEVKLLPDGGRQALSMAGVLALTVTEALAFFAAHKEVTKALAPLQAVGLGYLRLGQPVPTLSGGEAQRLKLAGHLAKSTGRRRRAEPLLFLFDEPTTGLHFDDIAKLLGAFDHLLAQGHSLLVIEHNLDLIRSADWILDLGPEGGDGGGHLVCEGTPEQVMACPESRTGRSLADYLATFGKARTAPTIKVRPPPTEGTGGQDGAIRILNAREHNLKGLTLEIPRDRFTVITGISGSGKSTVAFDILFAEGQRRYLESLNAYARQFVQPASRPEVDAVQGMPPTVAIEQRTSRGGRKSTVATLTEIHHFLRLLYVKLGVQHCPDCRVPIQPQTPDVILSRLLRDGRSRTVTLFAPLVVARKGYYTDLAAWALNKGFDHLRVDGEALPTAAWPRLDRFREHDIDLPVGTLTVTPENAPELDRLLEQALALGKGRVRCRWDVGTPPEILFSTARACPDCGRSFQELDPRLFSYNSKHGWCPECCGTGAQLAQFDEQQTGEESRWQPQGDEGEAPCPACHGQRLRPEALAVRFAGQGIAELSALPVSDAGTLFRGLQLQGREREIARDLVEEILSRLGFLETVGLGYLGLDRGAPSLSGGEAQRIRLAAQLGSNLRGVCYILDEPTIGLHPRDNRRLLDTLRQLQAKGNTVVVVEHDEETIRAAQHLLDLGPGAGRQGGELVAQGSLWDLRHSKRSLTGRFLDRPLRHPLQPRRPVDGDTARLSIRGARLHNLGGFDLDLPLGRLVCVSGVSGSGKSTLVRELLHASLKGRLADPGAPAVGCDDLRGWEPLQRVLEVDQTPIGKTPRSCPATYVGFYDSIRKLFAATTEARMRGFGPARFSFNVSGGRCTACDGQGVQRIEMNFLPDVEVPCEVCSGDRFNPETLAVRYKDRNIAEVLAMNVDQALELFGAVRAVQQPLELLQAVGLGYLSLGQRSPTLSGGEAQRIKLVTELARSRAQKHTLYILDEPTIGLHMADEEKLIRVLHRLVDAGNTVLLIEHSLDLVAEADWLVDLGPEGGDGGGQVVAQDTPERVAATGASHTARFLAEFLAARGCD